MDGGSYNVPDEEIKLIATGSDGFRRDGFHPQIIAAEWFHLQPMGNEQTQ
jgi:hypothetical protein